MSLRAKLFSALLLLIMYPATVLASETIYFYNTDPAGTPIVMTDSNANVVWQTQYKPFGEEWSTLGNAVNNKRFTGKDKDDETGLNYFDARYMLAPIGRFISPDPYGAVDQWTSKTIYGMLANPQRLNSYAYSLNNPYKYLDPNGKFPIIIPLIIALGYNLFFSNTANAPAKATTPLISAQTTGQFARDVIISEAGGIALGRIIGITGRGIAPQIAERFASSAERLSVLRRVLTSDGEIKFSGTVTRQLADQRKYITFSQILETIGRGTRVADPQGVASQFMYSISATKNGSEGVLDVLVNEKTGLITHVLFKGY